MKKAVRNKVSEKTLIGLLKKYKKVKVIISSKGQILDNKSKPEVSRERILTNKGSSLVRYYEPKWRINESGMFALDDKGMMIQDGIRVSRYQGSCYGEYVKGRYARDHYKRMRSKAEAIVKAMKHHDYNCYYITGVYVGKGFKKKVA
jgi:hypothetical protein